MRRKLQRSVTEMRRSRKARPRASRKAPPAYACEGRGSDCPRTSCTSMTVLAMNELYSDRMLERPRQQVAVVLEREAVESRWETHRWNLVGVVPDVGGEARVILDAPPLRRSLHPGFELTLFPDEAEGYY